MNESEQPYVRWLDELGDDNVAFAGRKALNLARLRQAGFNVPNGFIVNASFRSGKEDKSVSGDIPRNVRDEILGFYGKMGSPAVAVRSSAVAEDSSVTSFAGQARTVLNVRTADALIEAVGSVLRSLDESRARSYAERMGVLPENRLVHVIVQRMVEAESSGVLFTCNPVSGSKDQLVINATWGLGELVVSGRVTPDQIVFDKTTRSHSEYVIGDKSEVLTTSGLKRADPEKAAVRCLADDQLRVLAETGRRIEERFGGPQDIEWAWADGLYILQTRPLTTPAKTERPERLLEKELNELRSQPNTRRRVWAVTGIAELLRCPTPLSWEVASRLMSGREGYGLAQQRIGYDPTPQTILERIAGHVYVDLDRESKLFWKHAPIGYALSEIRQNPLRVAMPRQVLDWRKLKPILLVMWPILIWQLLRVPVRLRRLRREFRHFFEKEFLPDFEQYVWSTRARDLYNLDADDLMKLFKRRLEHFLCESAPVLMTGSILAAMSYRELEDLLIKQMGAEGIEFAQQLTSGLEPNPTLQMHRAMCSLAHGEVSEEQFINRFGHRCGNEFELAEPRWREDRNSVREQLSQLADSKAPSGETHLRGQEIRHEAEAKLNRLSKEWGRLARKMLSSSLETARLLFPLRECTKDYLMMEYELLRAPLVALDCQLGLEGGIFYLFSDELWSAVRNPKLAREKVTKRRHEHQLQQRLRLPQVILGSQLFKPGSIWGEAGLGALNGVGVSSGLAQGPAHILKTIEDAADLQEGEILVLPSLDPTWTVAFAKAAGLVAERGAVLSHGAILAREFNLPAVVNIVDATSRLTDGKQVSINGSTGTVQLLDNASS